MVRRGRRNSYGILLKIVLAAVFVYCGYSIYEKNAFLNSSEFVEKSELNGRNFNTKVEEVVSPRYKIKAYLFKNKTNPIIAMNFMFKNAGYASEDENKLGIANLATEMLISGAGDLNDEQFKEKLEDNAISIGFHAEKDDFPGSLLTTVENKEIAFEMLKNVLEKPRFESDDLLRAKQRLQEALRQQSEHPESVLRLEFNKELYGTHQYGRNPLGKKDTIDKITAQDLRDFMKRNFAKSNLIVGVAGDITVDELGAWLDRIFGGLPENANMNFVRNPDINFVAKNKDIKLTTAQNTAMFAVEGVSRNDTDFYPLYVANFILGGSGLTSRLSLAARENEGLTYSIWTTMGLADKSPLIIGSFSSTPEKFDDVVQIMLQEWRNFATKGATALEVEEAKKYLIASYNLRFAAISDIAEMMMLMQRDNLGVDFLQKRNNYVRDVSLEQVNRVAAQYYNAEKLVRVNIGVFAEENKEHE